jgi:hypothetical protein
MSLLTRLALWLHAALLRCYPRLFRTTFEEEMGDLFAEAVQGAAEPRQVVVLLLRELRDWPFSCLREHLYERKHYMPDPHQAPPASGWGAFAVAFPFLVPFALFMVNPAGFLVLPIILIAGVIIAWLRRWPGWIVVWLGFLIVIGQNWLPSFLLGPRYFNNPAPSLLSYALPNIVLPILWYVAVYFVILRWPRHGLLVGLPFISMPWAFSMEFASQAMSAVVYGAHVLLIALFAMAIYVQRRIVGDVWLFYLAAIVPGAIITGGAVLFSPGMESAWRMYGGHVLEAVVPFMVILVLATLHAWSRERGSRALRATAILATGSAITYTVLLAFPRLVMPSLFDSRHDTILDVSATFWLLGALITLWGAWRLRAHLQSGQRRHLANLTLLLLLLPFIQHPNLLSDTIRSMTYRQRTTSALHELLPAFSSADGLLTTATVAGLLLLPFTIAHLRRRTDAFSPTTTTGLRDWWQQRGEQSVERATPSRRMSSRRKRLAVLISVPLLIGAGAFLAFVFIPLQLEAEPYTAQVALGDLDGDGDLDVVLANTRRLLPTGDNSVLHNDGSGAFTLSTHAGQGASAVVLFDISGNGYPDILFGGWGPQQHTNDGQRLQITRVSVLPLSPESGGAFQSLATGDLNGDGYTDVFAGVCCGTGISNFPQPNVWVPPANRVLFGTQTGLTTGGQALGVRGTEAVALGDLDGDGDLDAFVGNTQSNGEELQNDQPNEVWLNDGQGRFSDSGQLLGRQRTYSVALGDVDGDGDLDALVGNEGADELWLNDGQGRFTLARQSWSGRRTMQVFLIDLDGDGDLDAVTGHELSTTFAWYRQAIIWWNDGTGAFTRDRQRIFYGPNAALAIGDVTGDGRLNIVAGAIDAITILYP